jgi:hypothetical protein
MAEQADAPDLKSGGEMQSTRAGSNPAIATKFEIPFGCELGVSKSMYESFESALIKQVVEKSVPIEVGALGGIKIFVQPHIPPDMVLIVGPDPNCPGRTTVLKIIKFVP